MTAAATAVNEYDAIARTIQHYVDGGKSGRGEQMKAAFHPGATIFGSWVPICLPDRSSNCGLTLTL